MAASKPHDLFVGEMGATGSPNLLTPGPRVGRRGGLTWQQDTAGNWIRLLGAAASVRSEATSRGLEVRSANSPPVTNIIRVSRNYQQLHRELLFTHRKGLSLRSKPELLQVLEHRNRRREGMETSVELSPLEQELQRWQQRREQRQQQEESSDTPDHQPEFVRVRGNLRRIQHAPDVPPQPAKPSMTPSSFLRPHLTNAEFSRVPASPSPEVPDGDSLQLRGSTEASSVSSARSQCSLANS
ncbi:uncharacterized protein LOC125429493 isoform X1 [Sphaerodactylus townsendi]|uniref:uncharacterized protein LOC125429493 isoform X1 n=1 Tax=Sphaerodactylus townsendi TaxID=933632 RepID=UPI002025DE9A|nr:uncharacterized protein LOC125429493 isoform X1 [Sphaerodactylus townsendi]